LQASISVATGYAENVSYRSPTLSLRSEPHRLVTPEDALAPVEPTSGSYDKIASDQDHPSHSPISDKHKPRLRISRPHRPVHPIHTHDQSNHPVYALTRFPAVWLAWLKIPRRILLHGHAISHPTKHRLTAMPNLLAKHKIE
jgi:hypothetical protein